MSLKKLPYTGKEIDKAITAERSLGTVVTASGMLVPSSYKMKIEHNLGTTKFMVVLFPDYSEPVLVKPGYGIVCLTIASIAEIFGPLGVHVDYTQYNSAFTDSIYMDFAEFEVLGTTKTISPWTNASAPSPYYREDNGGHASTLDAGAITFTENTITISAPTMSGTVYRWIAVGFKED